MAENICPNIGTCRMVATKEVVPDEKEREHYIDSFCRQGEEIWGNCIRFHTKKKLGFCPDFVVPDTALSIDEIIVRFEEESNNIQ